VLRLSAAEYAALISQSATSKPRRGGRRKLPWAFTEHGAIQAANVLNSARAIAMGVYVVRGVFTRYFLDPSNANAAPCGSAACTIQPPPGTWCGPCMILPPLSLTRLAAASISPTLK
jgi:hypothetical protein